MKCGVCKTYDVTVAHVRACCADGPSVVAPEPVREPVSEEGIYLKGETYCKVVRSDAGRLYAKAWVDGVWDYSPGAIRLLFADEKVSAVQAAQFGALTGRCVFCTKRLTDERSIEVGYGAICAENNSLPWG